MRNTWRRTSLAIVAVPLLAAPSAYGVYQYLEPESGKWPAASAAIGFELLYLGVNILVLRTPELRAYGRRVAIAAVVTAVTFNALAHYAAKVPRAFAGTAFAPLPALLALLTALPLAGLAYAVSVLLHRLSDAEHAGHPPEPLPLHVPSMAVDTSMPIPAMLPNRGMLPLSESPIEPASERHACPACGTLLTLGQYGAARRYGYCATCKPAHA
jgi:hypothetical protein